MSAEEIIEQCEAIAAHQYPDDALAQARYLSDLLSTKVRELCFEPAESLS